MRNAARMLLLATGAIAAAGTFMVLATPRPAGAAGGCTLGGVRGTYGFQFEAFAPMQPGGSVATVPFAETGTFVVDAEGNINGASDFSFGGFIGQQTFNGKLTLNRNCVGQVDGTNETFHNPFHLRWVVTDPGEEIMLFSLEPGTVGNGRARRMHMKSPRRD